MDDHVIYNSEKQPAQEAPTVIEQDLDNLSRKMRLLGYGHLVVASGFLTLAAFDYPPTISPLITGGMAVVATMSCLAKLGYANRLDQAIHNRKNYENQETA